MSRYLLGVDVGTTSLKGCVFDENGKEIVSVSKAYELITENGFVEFPAEEYYRLFKEAFDELSEKTRIDAFAIDTQGETLIFLDREGKPLMNAIVWLDNRAAEEAALIEKQLGLQTVYEITGQTEVPAGYPAPKILWLKRNRPDLFAKLGKAVLLEDYLLYRLTGEFNCEKSLYSSTLYLDVRSGKEKVGTYRGASVSTGALDQVAGVIGSGMVDTGRISEMTGTALAVCALSDVLPPYFEGIKVSAYYMRKGRFCLLMWAPTAGMALEWFKKKFLCRY